MVWIAYSRLQLAMAPTIGAVLFRLQSSLHVSTINVVFFSLQLT